MARRAALAVAVAIGEVVAVRVFRIDDCRKSWLCAICEAGSEQEVEESRGGCWREARGAVGARMRAKNVPGGNGV